MNMPPANSQTSVNTESRPREVVRAVDSRDSQQQRDTFEELLRSKLARRDEGEDVEPTPDGAGVFGPGALPALQTTRPATVPVAGAVEEPKTGPRAAIEAQLSNPAQPVSPLGATEPAAVWEASVREANSVPVDMRFTRAEKTAADVQPGWTMTVGSSSVNAEMLARHAPRLNERLRKSGVGLDHVRIQRDEGDA